MSHQIETIDEEDEFIGYSKKFQKYSVEEMALCFQAMDLQGPNPSEFKDSFTGYAKTHILRDEAVDHLELIKLTDEDMSPRKRRIVGDTYDLKKSTVLTGNQIKPKLHGDIDHIGQRARAKSDVNDMNFSSSKKSGNSGKKKEEFVISRRRKDTAV
jgi:hypothetical protein